MAVTDFLLNSDYPLDKVILINPTSGTSGDSIDITVPHGLPFTPLPWFQWSFTPDFSVAYEDNTGNFPSGNLNYFFNLQLSIEANATNIIIRGNGVLLSSTVYLRIFAFQPSTSNVELPGTESLADNFVINSDYNYMKLFDTGVTGSIAGAATTTVTHGLGYKPQILAWSEDSLGTIYPMSLSWALVNVNVEVTSTQMIIRNDSFTTQKIHYRIYLDA